MKDPSWRAVYDAIAPLLKPSDVVLAPRGEWAPFPCSIRFYGATVPVADATVLILHKGRLAGLPKPELALIMANWPRLFANQVFVVFARPSGRRLLPRWSWPSDHVRLVNDYLASRRLKVLPSTIYHVHVPKTGGTAVWHALSRLFRSRVYYGDFETFFACPPEPGDYDLVGLHGPPALLDDRLKDGDLIVGLLRDPAERFFSTIVHSRRASEDAETLTASQRAMREMRAIDFLATPNGHYEAKFQLMFLGHAGGQTPASDRAALAAAMAVVGRRNTLFAPATQSQAFLKVLLDRFAIEAPLLQRRNSNPPEDYARYAAEFREATPLLESLCVEGRLLFDAVSERFRRGR